MNAWHDQRDGQWLEQAPPARQAFARNWLLRQNDLVEKYRPDLVYFDDYGLPFGQIGIDAVAHFYALSRDVVVTAKRLSNLQRRAIVEDVERGFVADIQPQPWQTDTCIGNWHYDRPLYERGGYKSAKQVVQRLCDVVSKNGNLLLSIPMRGDGSIDEKEEAILDQLASWFAVNGSAIYGTRPWRIFGEGPTRPPTGMQNEGEAKPFVAEDVRFTTSAKGLHAIFLDWPRREALIHALGQSALPNARIERVEMVGGGPIPFRREEASLGITLPQPAPGTFVPAIRILGAGLA
jgi:alpha-L-fucosidase